MTCSHIF
jgi:hypothetical protein